MSQNDFTLANQSFPAFRADLNSALQALASNNSGTSAPSTTFANMWWYDSSNNIMYIRNEDNDAWIKFAELDQANDKFVLSGTLQLDDGTVSAPALTFNSDTNMGIYRGGTDILKFVTAGTDAVTIDASQNTTFAGTVTANELTIDSVNVNSATVAWQYGGTNQTYLTSSGSVEQALILRLDNQNLSSTGYFEIQDGSAGRKLLNVDDNGDISFYEDTGTTPKMVWSASNERLLVGNLYLGEIASNYDKIQSTSSAGLRLQSSGGSVYLDSSGNLLVGTTDTNPGNDSTASAGLSYNVGFGGQLIVRATANSPLMLNRTTSDGDIILFRKNGPDVGMIGTYGSALYMASPDGTDAGLRVGNSTVVPVTTTGALRDNAIDLGSASAHWKDLYLSGGIQFYSRSNKLDDYEEGSFTPTLEGVTTAGSGTYTVQVGSYTKVGNMVHVQGYLSWTNHTGTGDIALANLPFTSDSTTNNYSTVSFSYVRNMTLAANNYLTGAYVAPNATRAILNQTPVGGGVNSGVNMDTNAQFMFSCTYRAT